MPSTSTLTDQLNNARALRHARRQNNRGEDGENETHSEGRLRRARHYVKEMAEDMVSEGFHMGTAKLLVLAWQSLTYIITFPLTLIYLDIHALGRILLPNVFCPFGSEWKGGITRGPGTTAFKVAGWFEIAGIIALNVLAYFLIVIAMSITEVINDSFFAKTVIEIIDLWAKLKSFIP